MKKIFMMLGIASMITLISSCTSDPCKDKSAIELCSGKGTLADKNGTCGCNCDAGYTGTKCEITVIPFFIGNYKNSSNYIKNNGSIQTGPANFNTKIEQSGISTTRMKITNSFPVIVCDGADDVFFYIELTSASTFKFDESVNCDFKAVGSGVLNSNGTISIEYTITNVKTNDSYKITTNLTK
jgi:hypothetical protein